MMKWIIFLVITVFAYFVIDVGYNVPSHIGGLLLRGTGGGILILVGIMIKSDEK